MPRARFDQIEDHVEAIAADDFVYDDYDVATLHRAAEVLAIARRAAAVSRSRSSSMEALRGAFLDAR